MGIISKNKKNIVNNLLISLAITMILGLITPLDVIITNCNEFSASKSEMVSCLVLPSVLSFLGLFVFLSLLAFINDKIYIIIKSLIFGVVIAFYSQELFMNGMMIRNENGTVMGNISYNEECINVFIQFIIIFIPPAVIGYYVVTKDKENASSEKCRLKFFDDELYREKIVSLIFGGIIIMKSVGLVSDYISNDSKKYLNDETKTVSFFSIDPTFSFSKQKNVYVFIVDRFDSLWCDEFLECYPEVKNELEGFTFYQNNISSFTNTFPSITNMLTHYDYNGSAWYEYFGEAWNNENIFSILKNEGYTVNLLLDEGATYGCSGYIAPICDNDVIIDNLERKIDKKVLGVIIYKLSFMRVVPYTFKYSLEEVLDDVMMRNYITFKSEDLKKLHIGVVDTNFDNKLFDYTEKAVFNSDAENKVVTVIHINGAHDPNFDLTVKMDAANQNGNLLYATLRANFESLLRYIRAAKKLGVYDKTTFIVLGDHARAPEGYYDEKNNKCLTDSLVTTLMIKPSCSDCSEFQLDSKSELSNSMLAASILEYAGIDHRKFGESYNDVINNKKEVLREFHTYEWHGIGKVVPLHDYIVSGNAREFSNWKLIR